MSFISCIDEAYLSALSSRWLCDQVLQHRLTVDVGSPQMALAWQKKLCGEVGIVSVEACVQSGQLKLTYDLRHWSRQELLHRICPPVA